MPKTVVATGSAKVLRRLFQSCTNFRRMFVRIMRPNQRSYSRNVRRRHRCTTPRCIRIAWKSRSHTNTRSGNIHLIIVLRKPGLVLVTVDCSYRHDRFITCWIQIRRIATITSGSNKQHTVVLKDRVVGVKLSLAVPTSS